VPLQLLSIVITGENFPVESVDLGDFSFLGRPIRETVRLPMVVVAQAGEFRIQVLPDRFDVTVASFASVEDKPPVLLANAERFVEEYVGRRSVTAIGHNFQSGFATSAIRKEEVLARLAHPDPLRQLFGGGEGILGDFVFQTRRGEEDRLRLSVVTTTSPDDQVVLDFNFHFDVRRAGGRPPREALEAFPESLRIASQIDETFPTLFVGDREPA
jgi:hypothetical protein